jgi:hypothetical protein
MPFPWAGPGPAAVAEGEDTSIRYGRCRDSPSMIDLDNDAQTVS